MKQDQPTPRQLGYYFAMAQVGLEMAVPIGLGWLMDHWLEWFPALTIVGAILGLVGGLYHLIVLQRQLEKVNQDQKP